MTDNLSPIYPNQRQIAEQVVGHLENGCRHVILCAQPQVGKTGTGRATIELALVQGLISEGRVYLICGMNYNNLKKQEQHEFQSLIPPDQILFSKDLEKILKQSSWLDFQNCLFLLDESHFAQDTFRNGTGKTGVSSLVHRFFTRIGLTLDGQFDKWHPNQQGSYILSISATAMSELAQFTDPEQHCPKQLVPLIPGDGYYGYQQMYQEDRLFQAKNLNDPNELQELSLLLQAEQLKQQSLQQYRYAIIRVHNSFLGRQIQQNLEECLLKLIPIDQYEIRKLHSQKENIKDINSFLNQAPKKFTIYYVYHSLRAGVQVNTRYVCLVHENHGAGIDTTVQGLSGRCCGYHKKEHQVAVYCNLVAIDGYLKLVVNSFDGRYIPSRCKNIKQSLLVGQTKGWIPNRVFKANLPSSLVNELLEIYEHKKRIRNYQPIYEKFGLFFRGLFEPLIPGFLLCQSGQLQFWQQYHYLGMMIFTSANKPTSWKQWWQPNMNGYRQKKTVCSVKTQDIPIDHQGIYFYFINLHTGHSDFGTILLTSKYRVDPEGQLTRGEVITSGREQFHPLNNFDLSGYRFDELRQLEHLSVIRSGSLASKKELTKLKLRPLAIKKTSGQMPDGEKGPLSKNVIQSRKNPIIAEELQSSKMILPLVDHPKPKVMCVGHHQKL